MTAPLRDEVLPSAAAPPAGGPGTPGDDIPLGDGSATPSPPEARPPELAAASAQPAPSSWWRRITRRQVWLGLAALTAAWLIGEAATWPDVAVLTNHHPSRSAFMDEYEHAAWFGPPRKVEWKWVAYSHISPHLKRAVLCGEDIGFFSHHGFETAEMKAALHDAWEEKRLPRGASTVTQQLAKNLWLSRSRNPLRKLKEALLTRQLESHLAKRRILELYLNFVELGPGIFGAEAAARHYFGKPAASLSEREAALLAASLPLPSAWHPGADNRAYRRHVQTVLHRMSQAGWLWQLI